MRSADTAARALARAARMDGVVAAGQVRRWLPGFSFVSPELDGPRGHWSYIATGEGP